MKHLMTVRQPGEVWDIGRGVRIVGVHSGDTCKGGVCVIHSPTDHVMSDFPHHWRDDREIMERICPHGVGHPDPDQREYWEAAMGKKWADASMVHGCDGCCSEEGHLG